MLARWQTHKETEAMQLSLQWLKAARPPCGVFENVCGMKQAGTHDDASAADYVMAEIKQMGYAVELLQLDLSVFHNLVRRRTALQFGEKFSLGKSQELSSPKATRRCQIHKKPDSHLGSDFFPQLCWGTDL